MASTSTAMRCTCCGGTGSALAKQRPALGSRPAAPACRPVKRRGQPVQASLDGVDGGAGAAGLLVQGLAWAGVAWYAAQVLLPKSQAEEEGPPQRECESCGGSGYVACWCNRWSDGDRGGCGTCGGSGRMVCASCRGGGTAVPIQARIYIDNGRSSDYGGQRNDGR